LNSAADFVRESVITLLDRATSWPGSVSEFFLFHPGLVIFSLVVVAVAVVLPQARRLRHRFGLRNLVLTSALLLGLLVGAKFIELDAPILKIHDLVTGGDASCWALVGTSSGSPKVDCREAAPPGTVKGHVWKEAKEVFGEIVCSRIDGAGAKNLPLAAAGTKACQRSMTENRQISS
jgi:hypothetical protein